MSDIAIRVQNITKAYQIYDKPQDRLKQSLWRGRKQFYREFKALDDVSFEVKKGETVGIIGRNGSGKSTLLQIICGTLAPTSGTVEVNGRVAALLELGAGFNPEFSGKDNVYMNATILGLSKEEIDAKYDEIVVFADIGDFIDQPVKTYSSGMMVRLAFAVAINVDPLILIVDEALSVGDELFQRKCFSRIEAIKNNGATILFVSHSGGTIVELCDHAVLLDAGEKLMIGEPKQVIAQYQKLIYAPDDQRMIIRHKIGAMVNQKQNISTSETDLAAPNSYNTDSGIEEQFDPTLIPQSTVVYESLGATIDSPEILTLTGEKVNYIKRGKTYRYTYKVKFHRSVTNVQFGMLIKTTSGLELGGSTTAPAIEQCIPYIEKDTVYIVDFRFDCNLNPGTYFLNAGVMGNIQNEHIYLHRVIDLWIFKVMPITENTATAIIDFNCVAEINRIHASLQKGAAL